MARNILLDTHTHKDTHTSWGKAFVGCNCEVMEAGLRGVRGQECVVGEASASSDQPGSCHMCVYVLVCVKNKNSKAIHPLVKNMRVAVLFQKYIEAFPDIPHQRHTHAHTLMHTHLSQFLQKE